MTVLLVALGAAVGAPVRFVAATWLDDEVPVGTFTVNLVGSFLLGLFSAWSLGDHAISLLGTGFCGGLTTYSAFAVQTHRLGPRRGATYAASTVVVALGACLVGFLLGS